MVGSISGLDVSAAVSKVKKEKQAAKKQDKKNVGKPKPRRNTASAFVKKIAGQAAAAAATVSARHGVSTSDAAARQATKPSKAMPLQQRLKRVFDFVRAQRKALSFEDVHTELSIPVGGDLLEALQSHSHVSVDAEARLLLYRPALTLASRDDIAALLRRNPFGVLSTEVADAYDGGRSDARALVAEGAAFEIDSAEKLSSVLFPNGIHLSGVPPDEAVRDALLAVDVPQSDAERDLALAAAGIPKAKRSTCRLRMAVIEVKQDPSKRPRKERKIRNATNVHLQHLFEDTGDGCKNAIDMT
jgi:hypothetical protein